MNTEILVAGGTGLVGANLTFRLRNQGFDVVATRCRSREKIFKKNFAQFDFRRFDDCLEATKNKNAVVLCAGYSYGAKENKKNPTGSILPNLQISAGLLEASARNGIRTVILLSSSTVYQPSSFAVHEEQLDLNRAPYSAYSGIGWVNRYLEQLAKLYTHTYGMRVVIFRPSSIYGPFDKFDDERSNVVPALIKRAVRKENPFQVWGSPEVIRDFIFVEDVVDDICSALTNETIPAGEPINVCSAIPMSIAEIVGVILKACDHSPEVSFDADKPSTIPYRLLDNKKHQRIFGKKKRTTFKDGVAKTIEWYKAQKR